jgi:hypothetical protein
MGSQHPDEEELTKLTIHHMYDVWLIRQTTFCQEKK